MRNCIWILLIASSVQLAVTFSFVDSSPNEDGELVFAHVVFRHGERNVERTYPNDPFQDETTFWPGGYGALTNAGKREVYELGRYLRKKYQKLIGTDYSPKRVYIRSTDFDRTLMSAQALAAGLYPLLNDQIWHEQIRTQLIPIHTIPIDQEHLLAWKIPCPRFKLLFEKQKRSAELKSYLEAFRSSIEYWELHTGMKLNGTVDIMYLYDTLHVENRRGLPLPEWARVTLNSNHTLEYLAAVHLETFTHTLELKKFEAGSIIKEMLDRFENKSQSILHPDHSLWIYSAHDLSLVNILNALNLYELHIPNFASSLHLELYRKHNNGEYYIEISYKKSSTEDAVVLEIPDCGSKCSLKRFSYLYRDILPTESYESMCRLNTTQQNNSSKSTHRELFTHFYIYIFLWFILYSMVC